MNKTIRLLRADEIEVRAQSVKDNGGVFLLYKDARCDMRILDEIYGIGGWQRSHEVINGNLFCTVEIWDEEKNQWIRKQDVGTESNTEKEKGQASDSFKRACFNIGIGRELYTAPFTWIKAIQSENLKYAKFFVSKIDYNENREIITLEIKDEQNRVRFSMLNGTRQVIDIPQEKSNIIEGPSDAVFEVINKQTTVEGLQEVWNTYSQYQRDTQFKNAVTTKKNELKAQLQPTG